MTIGSSAADYLQQLINLSPQGLAWPTDPNSNWVKLLDALAQTLARIDTQAVLLSNEAFPDTTTQLLPDWERVAGLPDNCSSLGDTYEIRRFNLITKLTNAGGQSIQYFINYAATLGYTITITEFIPFMVGRSHVGDPICGKDWWFAWEIHAPLNSIVYFRADSGAAEEPLESWGNTRLECEINNIKPAHTIALFAYA